MQGELTTKYVSHKEFHHTGCLSNSRCSGHVEGSLICAVIVPQTLTIAWGVLVTVYTSRCLESTSCSDFTMVTVTQVESLPSASTTPSFSSNGYPGTNCSPIFTNSISFCVSITWHLVGVLRKLNVFPVLHPFSQMFLVWPTPKCLFAKRFPLQSVYISKKIWAICFCFIGYAIRNCFGRRI